MKNTKKTWKIIAASAFCACALSIAALCAPLNGRTYQSGMFADVPETAWFAESVADAYESGLMRGTSDNTFDPDGTLSVAEAVAVAARIHGSGILDEQGGAWYEKYVSYAKEAGLFAENAFDDFERPVKRHEIASLLAAACGDLPAINDVMTVPDVSAAASFASDVLKLYRAGILVGNDDRGNFAPSSSLKRAELAAMVCRVTDESKRIRLVDDAPAGNSRVRKRPEPIRPRTFGDGYILIENSSGTGRTNRSIANGWDYDNRFEISNTSGWGKKYVADLNDTAFTALKRDFAEETEGLLTLEMMTEVWSKDGGLYIAFEDKAENRLFGLTEKDGRWLLFGSGEKLTDAPVPAQLELVAFTLNADLDKHLMTVTIDNRVLGSVALPEDARVSRLVLGTNEKGSGSANITHVKLFKNYAVIDRFPAVEGNIGEKPAAYEISGDFSIRKMDTGEALDVYSMRSATKAGETAAAVRRFEPVKGNIDVKVHLLLPEGNDGASVGLLAADCELFTVRTEGGAFRLGEKKLRNFTANVWQDIHIEANTEKAEALVRIDGKIVGTFPFDGAYIDGVKIAFAPKEDAVLWFDDLEIQTLCEHADYVPAPVKPESDYTIGMYSCNLWHDAMSGEGWDSVSSFPEFEPVLGYYDEGLRETADWEIKQMVDHGVDFLEYCWYAPKASVTAPIKRSYITHAAFHDGFLNAKYRDQMRFCLMWEQAYQGARTFEQFKQYLWPFWKEYYFSDDNYLVVDNKIVITCWGGPSMFSTFSGENREESRRMIKELDDDVKDSLGYDGVIWLAANLFQTSSSAKDVLAYGFAGYGGGGWIGTYSNNASEQLRFIDMQEGIAADLGMVYFPIISPGYNDVGRNDRRTGMISKEEHRKVCDYVKEVLDKRDPSSPFAKWLTVDSWNEYSEGHVSAPTVEQGFDYLDNIRDVFTKADAAHDDPVPTPEQKARINHLYPPHHSPIRWFMTEGSDTGKTESEPSKTSGANMIPTLTWDMATAEGLDAIKRGHGLADYKEEIGRVSATGNGDCSVYFDELSVDLAEAPVIHFRLWSNVNDGFQIYFSTDENPGLGETKKVTGNVFAGEHDYYVAMDTHKEWKGTLNHIRFDFINTPGRFAVMLVEFMKSKYDKENPAPELYINGERFDLVFQPVETPDGDYEIAAEATIRGFFSSMCLYHEWDRFDGVLTVKTRDKRTLVFTVGSDKVTVDGETRDLGYTLRLRDGLPVFQIKKFCDLIGYEYTEKGKNVYVTSATAEELALKAATAKGVWDYTVMTEVGDWKTRQCSVSVDGGFLNIIPTDTDSSISTTVDFAADDYTHALIGIKYTDGAEKWIVNLFFGTDTQNLGAPSCIVQKVITPEDHFEKGQIIELKLDMTSNQYWKGTIKNLRFDPHWEMDPVYVQYIRFIKDEENASFAGRKAEEEVVSDEFIDLPDVTLELADDDTVSKKYGLLLGEVGFEGRNDDPTYINGRFLERMSFGVYGERGKEYVDGKKFGKSAGDVILDLVPNGTAAHRLSIGSKPLGTPMKGTYTITVDAYIPQENGNLSTFRMDFGGLDIGQDFSPTVNAGKGKWQTYAWSIDVLAATADGSRLIVDDGRGKKTVDASAFGGGNLWIVKLSQSSAEHFYYDNVRLYYDPGTLKDESASGRKVSVLCFGNSILRHAPSNELGWSGDWGMAASAADKDYYHTLQRLVEESGVADVTWSMASIAAFEQAVTDSTDYGYEKEIEAYVRTPLETAKPDVVIFQMGENVADATEDSYAHMLSRLAAYCKSVDPDVKIIFTKPFWGGGAKCAGAQRAAKETGFPVADLSALNDDPYKAIDRFAHTGVASHPNDNGMAAIAEKLFKALRPLIAPDEEDEQEAELAAPIIYDDRCTIVTGEKPIVDDAYGILLGEVAFDYSYRMASELHKSSYPDATVYGSYVNGDYLGGFRIEMIGISDNTIVSGADTVTKADSYILDTVPNGTAAHRMQIAADSLAMKEGTYTFTMDIFAPTSAADYSIIRGDIIGTGKSHNGAVNDNKGKWMTVSWSFDVLGKDGENADSVIISSGGESKSVKDNGTGLAVWLQKVSPATTQHYYYDNVRLYYKAAE